MNKYQATEQTYLSNSKASVIFQEIYYTPKNAFEEELLEEWVTKGVVKKLGWVHKIKEKVEAPKGDTLLRDEYKNAHPENKDVPVNKKNDIDRIKNKIEEFNS